MQIYQFQTSTKLQKFLLDFRLNVFFVLAMSLFSLSSEEATNFSGNFDNSEWHSVNGVCLLDNIHHVSFAINIEYSVCLLLSVQWVVNGWHTTSQMVSNYCIVCPCICWFFRQSNSLYITAMIFLPHSQINLFGFLKPNGSVWRGVKCAFCLLYLFHIYL